MSIRRLEPREWGGFCIFVSRGFIGKHVELEVASLEIGFQGPGAAGTAGGHELRSEAGPARDPDGRPGQAYADWAPPETTIETAHIHDIPAYNEDVRQVGFPPSVGRLPDQVQRADALLIVTPEYNYSIPGVLKKAIDWVSRPPNQPFNEKPIAITGASPSMLGSARAQYDLRRCFVFFNSFVLNQPKVMVAQAHERFDKAGKLTHQGSQKLVVEQFRALVAFIHRVRSRGSASAVS